MFLIHKIKQNMTLFFDMANKATNSILDQNGHNNHIHNKNGNVYFIYVLKEKHNLTMWMMKRPYRKKLQPI